MRRLAEWRTEFGSAYPSAGNPYWRALPVNRVYKLLAGTFFAAAALGFAVDLLLLHHPQWMHGLFWPALAGAFAGSVSAARIKSVRVAILLWLMLVAVGSLAYRAQLASPLNMLPPEIYRRVVFDVLGIWLGTALGFRLCLSFMSSQGMESVRMQTELQLAHGIQDILVPPISFANENYEAYGKTIPSAEMGGDLIDLVDGEGILLAYIADVSGHGLPAGQLMGMLKTAMRLSLQFQQTPAALLEGADRVLPAVKEPGMYATLALLRFDGSGQGEYASAGHVPILHYRRLSGDVKRLAMQQFPLGLLPGGTFASERFEYSAGDLFLMLTDGISELEDERKEEFGLARLEKLLTHHAAEPLASIWEAILREVRGHGTQKDDQTMLLIRVVR